MGVYVNPPNQTKEEWLADNGEQTDGPTEITATHLPVCLVHNAAFSAAAIAYDAREISACTSDADRRKKIWYRVSREKLRQVSNLAAVE